MITTTYNYSSGTGFVYDPTKIGFVSSMAQLLLVNEPGKSYVPSISASAYDPSLLTYLGGSLEQLDQRPVTATYYSAWSSQLNANWSSGSPTVSAVNGAAITGGVLDLTGYTNKYATFSATGNANSFQTGTIEFQFKPNYSEGAAGIQYILTLCKSPFGGSSNSSLLLYHHPNAGSPALFYQIVNATGSTPVNIAGGWHPVAGTTYTFRLVYDGTAGNSAIYIDGVLFSIASTATFTRDDVQFVATGVDHNLNGNANFSISNLSFYSTVVTPTSPALPATIYPLATANLPAFSYGGLGAVQGFTSFTASDSNAPHYTMNGLYWSGSAWASSNGSYAQSNTSSVVSSNILALPAADTLQVNTIYQDSNTQSSLSSLSVGYTGQIFPTTNPKISPNASLSMDSLSVFDAVFSASGSDTVQFNFMIGSQKYWWDGSAWSVSNGSFAQSNELATIQTNLATLPVVNGAFVTPYSILHSSDGSSTPMLTSLTLTYDYFGPEPTPPNVCEVFGYILDENEIPIVNAVISVTNPTTFINGGVVIAQGVRTTKTNGMGYFAMNLIETASMSSPALLTFSVAYTTLSPGGVGPGFTPTTFTFGDVAIPNSPSVNIADLVFV